MSFVSACPRIMGGNVRRAPTVRRCWCNCTITGDADMGWDAVVCSLDPCGLAAAAAHVKAATGDSGSAMQASAGDAEAKISAETNDKAIGKAQDLR
jgi:hypothetical protein